MITLNDFFCIILAVAVVWGGYKKIKPVRKILRETFEDKKRKTETEDEIANVILVALNSDKCDYSRIIDRCLTKRGLPVNIRHLCDLWGNYSIIIGIRKKTYKFFRTTSTAKWMVRSCMQENTSICA